MAECYATQLFGVLYEWAGEERQYTTGRSGAPFAKPEFIQGWMRRQFDNLVRIPSQGLCGHYCTNTR
jgi:fido (protein-threonine AMPylation protein)